MKKIQIISLCGDFSLKIPHVTTVSDPHVLIHFLCRQKRPSLAFNMNPLSDNVWVKRGFIFSLLGFLFVIGIMIYSGISYKRKNSFILSKIEALKIQIHHRKNSLGSQNISQQQSALAHYDYIKSQRKNPLKTFANLSLALRKNNIRLDSLSWTYGEKEKLEIIFYMFQYKESTLEEKFNRIISSFRDIYTGCEIQIIEAPFKSSSHETYIYPLEPSPPRVQMRILFP